MSGQRTRSSQGQHTGAGGAARARDRAPGPVLRAAPAPQPPRPTPGPSPKQQIAPPPLPPKGPNRALKPKLQHTAPPSVARAPPPRQSRKSSADLLLDPLAAASAPPPVARAPPQRHSRTSSADLPLGPPAAARNPPARRSDSGDSGGATNALVYGKPLAQKDKEPNAIDPSSGRAVYCDPMYAGANGVAKGVTGSPGTQANYRPIVDLKRKGRAKNTFIGGVGGRSDGPARSAAADPVQGIGAHFAAVKTVGNSTAAAAPPIDTPIPKEVEKKKKKKKKKMHLFGKKEETFKSPPTPVSTHILACNHLRQDRTKATGQKHATAMHLQKSSGGHNQKDKTRNFKPPGAASTTSVIGHDYRSAANTVAAAPVESEYKPALDLLAEAVQKGDRPCPVCKELVWSNQDRFTEDHVTYVHHACEGTWRVTLGPRNSGLPARRGYAHVALTCSYSGPKGRCQSGVGPAGAFCRRHTCPQDDCSNSKPSARCDCGYHTAPRRGGSTTVTRASSVDAAKLLQGEMTLKCAELQVQVKSARPAATIKYDFFLSHSQATGADQVATIYNRLTSSEFGRTAWYDQTAQRIGLAGMALGIQQSRAVLLFLSAGVMARPFVLFELRCAFIFGKPVFLVHEDDEGHGKFDFAKVDYDSSDRAIDLRELQYEHASLAYHRRKRQQDEMMRQLLVRFEAKTGVEDAASASAKTTGAPATRSKVHSRKSIDGRNLQFRIVCVCGATESRADCYCFECSCGEADDCLCWVCSCGEGEDCVCDPDSEARPPLEPGGLLKRKLRAATDGPSGSLIVRAVDATPLVLSRVGDHWAGVFGPVTRMRQGAGSVDLAVKQILKANWASRTPWDNGAAAGMPGHHRAGSAADNPIQEMAVLLEIGLLNPHRNVVGLEWLAETPDAYMIALRYAGSSLFEMIEANRSSQPEPKGMVPLTLLNSRIIFKQAVQGLQHIHQSDWCHLDVSTDNIIVEWDANDMVCAKVIDFGLARKLQRDHANRVGLTAPQGKLAFMAPEIYAVPASKANTRTFDGAKADCWSAGRVLLELYADQDTLWRKPDASADPLFSDFALRSNRPCDRSTVTLLREVGGLEALPEPVLRLATKLLRIDPKDRWNSWDVCEYLESRNGSDWLDDAQDAAATNGESKIYDEIKANEASIEALLQHVNTMITELENRSLVEPLIRSRLAMDGEYRPTLRIELQKELKRLLLQMLKTFIVGMPTTPRSSPTQVRRRKTSFHFKEALRVVFDGNFVAYKTETFSAHEEAAFKSWRAEWLTGKRKLAGTHGSLLTFNQRATMLSFRKMPDLAEAAKLQSDASKFAAAKSSDNARLAVAQKVVVAQLPPKLSLSQLPSNAVPSEKKDFFDDTDDSSDGFGEDGDDFFASDSRNPSGSGFGEDDDDDVFFTNFRTPTGIPAVSSPLEPAIDPKAVQLQTATPEAIPAHVLMRVRKDSNMAANRQSVAYNAEMLARVEEICGNDRRQRKETQYTAVKQVLIAEFGDPQFVMNKAFVREALADNQQKLYDLAVRDQPGSSQKLPANTPSAPQGFVQRVKDLCAQATAAGREAQYDNVKAQMASEFGPNVTNQFKQTISAVMMGVFAGPAVPPRSSLSSPSKKSPVPRLSNRPNHEATLALAARRRSTAVSGLMPSVAPKSKLDFNTDSSLRRIVTNLKRAEPEGSNVPTDRPSSRGANLVPARRAGRVPMDAGAAAQVVPPRRPVIDWEQKTAATVAPSSGRASSSEASWVRYKSTGEKLAPRADEEYNTVQMMPEPEAATSVPRPALYESPQPDTYAVATDALGSGYDDAADRRAAKVHGKPKKPPKTCAVSIDGKMQIRDSATGSIVRKTGVKALARSSVTVSERQLGDGNFGVVMEGHWTQTLPGGRKSREKVAVKMLKKTIRKSQIAEEHANMLVEAETMAEFDHKNVVGLLGCVLPGTKEDEDMCFLVVKFAMKGSLLNILQKKQRNTGHLFEYSVGIARGMEHLASKNFIHRDLAARNVLVDASDTPKISDFGLSRGIRQHLTQNPALTNHGQVSGKDYYCMADPSRPLPIKWLAPEVLALDKKKFTEASDVWAFGILMIEVYTDGQSPYSDKQCRHPKSRQLWDLDGVRHEVKNGFVHPQPSKCPGPLYDGVVVKCLSFKVGDRPKFKAIVIKMKVLVDTWGWSS